MRFSSRLALCVLAVLAAGPASANELYDAAKARNVDRVVSLLRSGADPNVRSPYDGPLHVAARLGLYEAVSALLAAGANVELTGYGGVHPLHVAALAGQDEIVSLLLRYGARVDALDNNDRTPLMTLISGYGGNLATLRLLLAAGANPNMPDGTSERLHALDYTAMHGRIDEANLLIKAGANINAQDNLYGKSPLHFAISFAMVRGNQEIVQFFIESGADVNAKDKDGKTPLDLAKAHAPKNKVLHDILVEAGAK
jgi:ankyrin repeat protein